ncbi:FBXO6 [Branchiostoma lanceolatum]|uniref:FBXO6 protein n=1 Tax=Branchiostoma lanceolatum TaxID=7740 RepID=A0A8J9VEZ1_BRALA|nr:FBXO6 [Branchiostoma lanceolatum]
MGATPSKKKVVSNGSKPEEHAQGTKGETVTDQLSYEGFDITLAPEEVLVLVLSFLPAKELVLTARLVCKDWKDTVDRPTIWRKKCLREGRFVARLMGPQPTDWRTFYFKNPYRRNLVKNPSGEEGMRHWEVLENGGQGWKVEKFVGCKAFPNPAVRGNFVTSYGWCARQQEIDLLAEGYAPRWDCGSQYELEVQLLDKDKKVVDTFSYGPAITPQWNDSQWKQAMHIFSSYGPGVRYVLFKDKGSDTQFWAGHYGSKMTCASVTLIFQ